MYNHNKAQQSKNRVHISWDTVAPARNLLESNKTKWLLDIQFCRYFSTSDADAIIPRSAIFITSNWFTNIAAEEHICLYGLTSVGGFYHGYDVRNDVTIIMTATIS